MRARFPSGCSPTTFPFECSFSFTNTSGIRRRVASSAVVLLSGGLDSYTAAAIAQQQGFSLYALTVRYGQRHAHELHAARAVAAALGVERHVELDVNLSVFGGSSLTSDMPVPKDRALATPSTSLGAAS